MRPVNVDELMTIVRDIPGHTPVILPDGYHFEYDPDSSVLVLRERNGLEPPFDTIGVDGSVTTHVTGSSHDRTKYYVAMDGRLKFTDPDQIAEDELRHTTHPMYRVHRITVVDDDGESWYVYLVYQDNGDWGHFCAYGMPLTPSGGCKLDLDTAAFQAACNFNTAAEPLVSFDGIGAYYRAVRFVQAAIRFPIYPEIDRLYIDLDHDGPYVVTAGVNLCVDGDIQCKGYVHVTAGDGATIVLCVYMDPSSAMPDQVQRIMKLVRGGNTAAPNAHVEAEQRIGIGDLDEAIVSAAMAVGIDQ